MYTLVVAAGSVLPLGEAVVLVDAVNVITGFGRQAARVVTTPQQSRYWSQVPENSPEISSPWVTLQLFANLLFVLARFGFVLAVVRSGDAFGGALAGGNQLRLGLGTVGADAHVAVGGAQLHPVQRPEPRALDRRNAHHLDLGPRIQLARRSLRRGHRLTIRRRCT